MNISSYVIITILAITFLSGIITICLLKGHRIMQFLAALFFLATLATTSYFCYNTRNFTDWHSFTHLQWWLFANLIVAIVPVTTVLTRSILRLTSPSLYSSRRSLFRAIYLIIGLIPAYALFYGAFIERYDYHVKRISLPIDNLPQGFDNFHIALISDTHIGSLNGDTTKLSAAIDSVNACHPDMVLFLGDVVNCFAEEAEGFSPLLKRISATHKFAIMGNHDIPVEYSNWSCTDSLHSNISRISRIYSDAGFTLLNNRWLHITCGSDTIILAGAHNQDYSWLNDSAYVNSDFIKIAMIHSPEFHDTACSKFNADVTFYGHTHGGQLAAQIPFYGTFTAAKFRYKYDVGLFSFQNTSSHGTRDALLYVNAGLGVNALPFRLGMPPEITLVSLNVAQ